jgi:hypothetical protein
MPEPPVAVLLDVDREYREAAAAGRLPRIAPRRFNRSGEAWLPILHAERGAWQFTALFSNTARAHELGKTRDWIVVYFHTDTRGEGQRTVVTETHGPLTGRRVVRGREEECRIHHEASPRSGEAPRRPRSPAPSEEVFNRESMDTVDARRDRHAVPSAADRALRARSRESARSA